MKQVAGALRRNSSGLERGIDPCTMLNAWLVNAPPPPPPLLQNFSSKRRVRTFDSKRELGALMRHSL